MGSMSTSREQTHWYHSPIVFTHSPKHGHQFTFNSFYDYVKWGLVARKAFRMWKHSEETNWSHGECTNSEWNIVHNRAHVVVEWQVMARDRPLDSNDICFSICVSFHHLSAHCIFQLLLFSPSSFTPVILQMHLCH